jgi:hypothetical protein
MEMFRGRRPGGYRAGVTGEASRRRLRAAGHAFAANARNPAVRRLQLGSAGACTAPWAFTVVLSVYALYEGGLVGEIARLRQAPRTATVRVLTEMDLRLLDAERFLLVVTGRESSREATSDHVDALLERFTPGEPSPEVP